MSKHMLCAAGLALAVCLAAPHRASGQTLATFDFDTGSPTLFTGQNTPFDQTAAGVTAHFSSPSGAAFSIQSDSTTGWKMSQFSGKYIYDNNLNKNALDIKFSQSVTSVTFTFATADFQQVEVPTTVQLTAYVDSTSSTAVGTATAHGTYGPDTMPMGKLTFTAGGAPFNLVEIGIQAGQPSGASSFFVDNVTVTLANVGPFLSASAASLVAAAPIAPETIVSGFGTGLASSTAPALSLPLPTSLGGTTVTLKDVTGVTFQAPLFMVSPTQINYLVPLGMAPGLASVTVANGSQVVAAGSVTIAAVAPALFTANADGKGAPAAEAVSVAPDWTQTFQAVAQCGTTPGSCVTSPIDLGPSGTIVVLCLYGTGIRGSAAVTASIGGLAGAVLYAGPQPQYVGLDQVNVIIPQALAGRGEVDLILTTDGAAANTVRVNIK